MKYLIAALSLLASVSAFARPIVVGVEQASFLPHYSVDEQGRYHGYARDVLDLFAAVEGVELTFRPMPAEALLPALLAGAIIGGYLGSHLAIRKGNLWIKRAFEGVTILIGLKLILS